MAASNAKGAERGCTVNIQACIFVDHLPKKHLNAIKSKKLNTKAVTAPVK